MLVLVLNALTPLAAQAMRIADPGGDMIEVCTSIGMVRIALDPQQESDDPETPTGLSCPFCLLQDGQAMLPPSPQTLSTPRLPALMPAAFFQAAKTSAVWLSALSRGPPRV